MNKGEPTGKLLVIEGLDGSGKETQTNKLYQKLLAEGFRVKKIDFPRYHSPSSALVKMYLNGDFGDKAQEVSPYIASTFYAVDRYASFKEDWETFYQQGGIVIADRYTSSNMVHQAGKILDLTEREKFLDWLWEFEFHIYKIPIPNQVFFLDMPTTFNKKLMEGRNNKFTGEAQKDIHERDAGHLSDAYLNANSLVEKYKWIKIPCVDQDQLRSMEEIHNEIYKRAMAILTNKE